MIIERDSNALLYFIVGALLVAVVAFAYFQYNGASAPVTPVTNTVTNKETLIERIVPVTKAEDKGTSTSVSVDKDGASVTTTKTP